MSCVPLRASNVKATKAELEESLTKANKVRQSILKKKKEANNRSTNLSQRVSPSAASDSVSLSNTVIPFPVGPLDEFPSFNKIDESLSKITYTLSDTATVPTSSMVGVMSIFDSPTVVGVNTRAVSAAYPGEAIFWQETDKFNFNNKGYQFGCLVIMRDIIGIENDFDLIGTGNSASNEYALFEIARSADDKFFQKSLLYKVYENRGDELDLVIPQKVTSLKPKGDALVTLKAKNLIENSKVTVEFFMAEIVDGVTGNLTSIGYPSKTQGFTYSHLTEAPDSVDMPEPIEQKPVSSSSYDVDEARPYGPIWKTTLPPGYPVNAYKCSTKQSASKVLKAAVDRIINELVQTNYPQIQNITNYREEILSTYEQVCKIESAGILYAPQGGFDIRPQVGKGVSGIRNLLDTGPRPRSIKKRIRGKVVIKTIDSTHRPGPKGYFSACGLFQYTIDTWKAEFNKWKGHWGATENYTHVWDAPPEWQVLVQGSNFIETIYARTTPDKIGGLQYPAIWRAVALYLKNVHNSPGTSFITATIEKINEAIANSDEELTSDELHIICRNVWESRALRAGNWYYTSTRLKQRHLEQSYRVAYKMALAPGALPSKYPNIYASSSNLLPDRRK